MNGVRQVSARELHGWIAAPSPPCVLDVREDWEWQIAHIAGSRHIPLNQLPIRLKELDAPQTIIVVCKAGGRSQMAAEYLRAHGYADVANLAGGIDAWARDIEPDMERY